MRRLPFLGQKTDIGSNFARATVLNIMRSIRWGGVGPTGRVSL